MKFMIYEQFLPRSPKLLTVTYKITQICQRKNTKKIQKEEVFQRRLMRSNVILKLTLPSQNMLYLCSQNPAQAVFFQKLLKQ